MMGERAVRVAVVGAGFVGRALVELLLDPARAVALEDAATAPVELVGVAVRDVARPRPGVPAELVTGDVEGLIDTEGLDILVEVAGGIDPARAYIERALDRGVSVVTANKALMALAGTQLARRAHDHGADLFYEAAVGGAVPILRALRTSLAGERIERVMGIVNGTTNFILSKMTSEGSDYAEALAEAQALGYAEADPSADVEGFDAAAKVQILASLAFGTALQGEEITREGIAGVRSVDVDFAHRSGYVIKLLGVAERVGEHGLSRRVHPAMVPIDHPLAAVNGAMNAVFVEGTRSGPLMWLGQGAGGHPTATAVLGDVLDAARNRVSGRHDIPFSTDATLESVPTGEVRSVFYLSLDVLDRPGVLAAVAGVFGRHGVSIRTMEQFGVGDEARLSFLTHEARTADVEATLAELAELEAVDRIGARLRVIGGEGS
jgi:homoserine dehydrogenase